MSKSVIIKIALFALYMVAVGSIYAFILQGHPAAILNPQGTIADQQRSLMIIATLLMLVVVVPVFVLTFWIAWKYRASNKKAKHTPNWDHNRVLESIWWGLPCAIIAILAVITWSSSHQLDPFKALASDKQAVNVQVIALEWKWLFLYPDLGIATVNQLQFPQKTPVNFQITSDAPMNSFWIPSLGGQVYAMSGMSTQLHLMADGIGSYNGSSANISGKGFAGMKFVANSTTDADFNKWITSVKHSSKSLDMSEYSRLAAQSENNPATSYVLKDSSIYAKIISKYMGPMTPTDDDHKHDAMRGMSM